VNFPEEKRGVSRQSLKKPFLSERMNKREGRARPKEAGKRGCEKKEEIGSVSRSEGKKKGQTRESTPSATTKGRKKHNIIKETADVLRKEERGLVYGGDALLDRRRKRVTD